MENMTTNRIRQKKKLTQHRYFLNDWENILL